jgi:hypothetical protein
MAVPLWCGLGMLSCGISTAVVLKLLQQAAFFFLEIWRARSIDEGKHLL